MGGGEAAIRERRHGNTNRKHYVIQDHVKYLGLLHSLFCPLIYELRQTKTCTAQIQAV